MPTPVVQVLLDDGSGAFPYDISAFVDLKQGVSISRGRQDEFAEVQPSSCSLTLDNTDGRFTFGYAPAAVNLIANGSFESGSTGGYSSSDGTLAASTSVAKVGSHSLELTLAGAGSWFVELDRLSVPSSASDVVFQLAARAGTTARQLSIVWRWYDIDGVFVAVQGEDILGTDSSAAWSAALSFPAAVPTGAVYLDIQIKGNGGAVGEKHYLDAVMLEVGTSPSTYADAPPPVRVDTPIKVRATVDGVTTDRFTGYVNTWPVEWPGGNKYSEAKITATDKLARLSRRKLRSVLEESILAANPDGYYVLSEAAGATAAGDTAGGIGLNALQVTQKGTGGTLEFGAGTGPRTDGHSAPTFTRASAANGLYLTGPLGAATIKSSSFWVRCSVSTSVSVPQTFVVIEANNGAGMWFGSSVLGYLRAVGDVTTVQDTVTLGDGAVHDVVAVADAVGGTFKIYKDGAQVASAAYSSTYLLSATRVSIGGGPAVGDSLADGTISHVAFGAGVPTAGDIADWYTAGSDGFVADSSDERIARYAAWANIDPADLALEVGDLSSVAHQDTTGMSPAAAMQTVAGSEQGIFFVDGSGQLVFHARSHRYTPTPVLTLDAHDIGTDSSFVLDTQGLINSVTATRDGGATQVYEVASSIGKYEQYPSDLSLLVTTDDEALIAAAWVANTHAEPIPRLPAMTVDLLTQDAATAADVQAVELGDAITLENLPSQAPWSEVSLFAEGWAEQIGTDDWSMTFNTSPLDTVWVLEDPVSGFIDSTFRLAY